ncbi:MAG: hypothetical protein OJF47_000840 [Nitrospira sp.]|nr:MAG: hypothetical protein OJF47_000840 [Nitrospira sp.]
MTTNGSRQSDEKKLFVNGCSAVVFMSLGELIDAPSFIGG